jgi:ferredoxin
LTLKKADGTKRELAFDDTANLFSVLNTYGIRPKPGHCLGNRLCAKCKVVISKGPQKDWTESENVLLGDAPPATHLACDLRLGKDFDGAEVVLDF